MQPPLARHGSWLLCTSIMAFFNIPFILQNTATATCCSHFFQRHGNLSPSCCSEVIWISMHLANGKEKKKSGADPEQCISPRQQDLPAIAGRSNWVCDKLWSPVQSRGSLTGWAGVWWASVSPQSSGAPQANQPPRRGSRSAFTPALHQHAGRGGNHQPISMCCYFTPQPSALHLRRRLWLSNQPLALLTSKALDGVKGGWWVQSNKVWQKR